MVKHPPQGAGALPGPTITATLDGSGASLTSSTLLTALKSYTLAANALGPNGILLIDFQFVTSGTNGTKTISVSFGGVTVFSAVTPASGGTANLPYWVRIMIINRNNNASQYLVYAHFPAPDQVGTIGTSTGGFAANTTSVDTTAVQTIKVQGQLANGGDSITLYGFAVRVAFSD